MKCNECGCPLHYFEITRNMDAGRAASLLCDICMKSLPIIKETQEAKIIDMPYGQRPQKIILSTNSEVII